MRWKRFQIPAPLVRSAALGILCAVGAFTLGVETAGDVRPFDRSEAALQDVVRPQGGVLRGDANGNGVLEPDDASIILQIAEGLEPAAPEIVRRGDTDGDSLLTAKDALRVLYELSAR